MTETRGKVHLFLFFGVSLFDLNNYFCSILIFEADLTHSIKLLLFSKLQQHRLDHISWRVTFATLSSTIWRRIIVRPIFVRIDPSISSLKMSNSACKFSFPRFCLYIFTSCSKIHYTEILSVIAFWFQKPDSSFEF